MVSPVQPGRDRPWLVFVGAGVAALIAWSLQHPSLAPPATSPDRTARTAGAAADPPLPAQRAVASLPSYFSSDDYPAQALRNDEQGTVAVKLSISRRGRVRRCRVTASSGSSALDRATCKIARRARFIPARNSAGRAVADISTARIKWVLPKE